jgi:hypothetical protein
MSKLPLLLVAILFANLLEALVLMLIWNYLLSEDIGINISYKAAIAITLSVALLNEYSHADEKATENTLATPFIRSFIRREVSKMAIVGSLAMAVYFIF